VLGWIALGLVGLGLLVLAAAVLSLLRHIGRLGRAAQLLNRRALEAQRHLQPALADLERQAEAMQRSVELINDRAAVLRARRG
jgi:hypothetical protein